MPNTILLFSLIKQDVGSLSNSTKWYNTILWLVDRYLGSETTFNNTSKIKYISLMVIVTH